MLQALDSWLFLRSRVLVDEAWGVSSLIVKFS